MNTVLNFLFYFLFYSILGWLLESVCCSIYYKKPINRGFMKGPFVPIYGAGTFVFSLFLTPFYIKFGYTWYVIIFVILLGVVIADILEYATSFAMEKLFNARWWDYSNEKFNLHGRICLKHSLYWAAGAGAFIYIIQPIVIQFNKLWVTDRIRNILVIVVGIVFMADYISTIYLAKKKKFRNAVNDDIKENQTVNNEYKK